MDDDYSIGHHYYGGFLVRCGRFQEGIAQLERAVSLDANDPFAKTMCAMAYVFSRDAMLYGRAIGITDEVVHDFDGFFLAHMVQGLAYERSRDFASALRCMKRAVETADNNPIAASWCATTEIAAGQVAEAKSRLEWLLNEKRGGTFLSPYLIARIYAALDCPTDALMLLQESFNCRDTHLIFLKVDPPFERMSLNVAYWNFVEQLGLNSGLSRKSA